MSHMLRFSAFIAMVMLSFALAFHAVFHTCGTDNSSNRSCPEETEESPLGDAFGTFGHSFVTVFSSALGGPNFDIFEVADSECSCDLPPGAKGAGIFLMVVRVRFPFSDASVLPIPRIDSRSHELSLMYSPSGISTIFHFFCCTCGWCCRASCRSARRCSRRCVRLVCVSPP